MEKNNQDPGTDKGEEGTKEGTEEEPTQGGSTGDPTPPDVNNGNDGMVWST